MEPLFKGKTKDVYRLEDGHILLKFKDDVTGEDGVFDPGANTVSLTIEGMGKSGLHMSEFFFKKLEEKGIPTHFIEANLEDATMIVKEAHIFGQGLEVICRFKAVGSFLRRYGAYCEEGQDLNGFVEVTLKDDERQDPPISEDALDILGILSIDEYKVLKQLTKDIAHIVKTELAKKNLELYDIKLEFGRDDNGELMLIDEISGGNMRVYRNNEYVAPLEIEKILFS